MVGFLLPLLIIVMAIITIVAINIAVITNFILFDSVLIVAIVELETRVHNCKQKLEFWHLLALPCSVSLLCVKLLLPGLPISMLWEIR